MLGFSLDVDWWIGGLIGEIVGERRWGVFFDREIAEIDRLID